MRHFYLCALLTAAAVIPLQAAAPFQKGRTAPRLRSFKSFDKAAAPQSSVVLEEDFSGFSEGSETAPGAEITYENGYHIPDSMTSRPGWIGGGVFPAGGAVALMDRENDDRFGFISTPPLDLGGTATLTFRAKRMPGGTGSLWIALCDDYYGPGADQADFILTDEWAEYTLVATNGELDELSYFQFQAENGHVLVDDVRIEFRRDRISTPFALPARNVSPTEFVARWEGAAPSYKLNVLCTSHPEVMNEGFLKEGFDGINVNEDGMTINAGNPGYPEGWEIDLSSNGSRDVSVDNGAFASAPLSLVFDAEGDVITSPVLPEPLSSFSFWVKPTSPEDDDYFMSLLRIELYHGLTGVWENVAHLPCYWMDADGGEYEISSEALGDDVTRVRISMIQRGKVDFMVDDVVLGYTTRGVTEYVLKDQIVEGNEYAVSGIDPLDDYYYFVKAVDGDIESSASEMIWVDGVAGLVPEVLPAENVKANSFTARWERLGHASSYRVDVSRVTRAVEDMKGVVVLDESFDGIDEEGMDWISPYDYSANGWGTTGWCSTQPCWKPGMAGTTGTSWIGVAGLVFTPRLDLSCNPGGGFDVEATVVTTVASFMDAEGNSYPEGMFVMVLNSHTDTRALASGFFETPEPGEHTATVHVDVPEDVDLSDVIVAFMNMSGTQFYVDHAKITQDLKAGDVLVTPYRVDFSKDLSLPVENLEEGCDHSYRVTASTRRNYVDYVSDASDIMMVENSRVSVDGVEAEGSMSVSVFGDRIVVEAAEDDTVTVYGADGSLRAKGIGSCSFSLPAGVYVVKGDASVVKVII